MNLKGYSSIEQGKQNYCSNWGPGLGEREGRRQQLVPFQMKIKYIGCL